MFLKKPDGGPRTCPEFAGVVHGAHASLLLTQAFNFIGNLSGMVFVNVFTIIS